MTPNTSSPDLAWSWMSDFGAVHLRFLGRGAPRSPDDLGHVLSVGPQAICWLRQFHSAVTLDARPGNCGEGDALVTSQRGLGLAIATADCVPVLFLGGREGEAERIGAAHAGWRGLVAGVLPAALEQLAASSQEVEAWIGPTIGRCCYEVGHDVAAELADVSGESVLSAGRGDRPFVDLQAVAAHQLATAGVQKVHRIDLCTYCHPDLLWSYRRDGDQAARNWALIWRD